MSAAEQPTPGQQGAHEHQDALRDGWRLAFGTLTLIPVKPPVAVTREVAGVAMAVAPLAVLPVAAAASLVGALLALLGVPELAVGLIVVGALAAGTRFIHADGLADTADGLGASFDRARALDVMRTGDVGPMGATTLILVLGAQAACAGALLRTPAGWVLLALALAGSRAALAVGTRRGVPAARPEGLGQAVAGSLPLERCLVVWGCLGLLITLVGALTGLPWWQGLLAVLAAAGASVGGVWWARRRLGGITGDVLGALVEVTALVLLVALAAV